MIIVFVNRDERCASGLCTLLELHHLTNQTLSSMVWHPRLVVHATSVNAFLTTCLLGRGGHACPHV